MDKKVKCSLVFCLLALLFVGCSKQKMQEDTLNASKEEFEYIVSEKANRIAVDENGLLYTVKSILPEKEAHGETKEQHENQLSTQIFEIYNLEGDCINQVELQFGTSGIKKMMIADDKIYCVVSENTEKYVYCISTNDWEIMCLGCLSEYQMIHNLVLLDNYLYVLGTTNQTEGKNYSIHPEVLLYQYRGEQICRINVTDTASKVEKMKIDYPISMFTTEQNTLMIYQYTEEKAFCFLEFDPVALTLTESEWSHTDTARGNLSNCGEGYTYINQSMLYYGTIDGTEVQLLPDEVDLFEAAVYKKGFLFFADRNNPGKIRRICIEDIIQDNKEIRMLTNQYPMDVPYGCGYQMSTHPVTADEFALKVLAQDSDFDAYLLSSREDCAFNLKENGAFYALNNIDGVQEYLDACFPYVKKLAYNNDGEIWMIPVGLAIPGIIYNKAYCAQNNVDYSEMDYLEFLTFLEKVEAENPELTSMSFLMTVEEMFMQYLAQYGSFDTEICRTYLKKIRDIYAEHGEWGINDVYGRSLVEEVAAEFYLDYNVYKNAFVNIAGSIEEAEYYGIIGTPKITEDIGNVGTITFLAVNPKAENLEDTLEYISEFAKYMITKQDSFLLADESMYTKTPFMQDLYHLYENGKIDFRMDSQVYRESFDKYIIGECDLEEAVEEAERKRKIYVGE